MQTSTTIKRFCRIGLGRIRTKTYVSARHFFEVRVLLVTSSFNDLNPTTFKSLRPHLSYFVSLRSMRLGSRELFLSLEGYLYSDLQRRRNSARE